MGETWTIKAQRNSRNPGFAAWHHGHVVAYGPTAEQVWAWLVSHGAGPQQIVVPTESAAGALDGRPGDAVTEFHHSVPVLRGVGCDTPAGGMRR